MPQPLQFPIDEIRISQSVGRPVKSPIRVSSLRHLGIDQEQFIATFAPFFQDLPWDPYDVRRLQVDFLKQQFAKEAQDIQALFKAYYLGQIDLKSFDQWIERLSSKQKAEFDQILPWRRRSVAQFLVEEKEQKVLITREAVKQFAQEVQGADYRSLPRIFAEAPPEHVENDLFDQWIAQVFRITQEIRPEARAIRMVAHFMGVKALPARPGDNSPEGAHEDGADYIVSALVIKRENLVGGESQIIEQLDNGQKEIIFQHELQVGEFIFQGDSRDEIVHGTDLWHHVTPFRIANPKLGEGWRDIIGFDINVIG
ncbi:MAG: 2OG-Fe dioxygenase family protein [Bacteroidota bacterium]